MADLPEMVFICIALLLPPPPSKKEKKSQNAYNSSIPSIVEGWLGWDGGGDRRSHSANTGCQLQRDDHHTRTLASHMFGSAHSHTHTHTRSAAPSLSNFLTFARTLICTSWPVSRGPYPLLWLWASGADTPFSHPSLPTASAAPFSLPPTPALTTSTKLTPQARSPESVGGVRCWHPPLSHHPPTQPLHWARLQALTACSLSLTVL